VYRRSSSTTVIKNTREEWILGPLESHIFPKFLSKMTAGLNVYRTKDFRTFCGSTSSRVLN
jgi:hypothetical protein